VPANSYELAPSNDCRAKANPCAVQQDRRSRSRSPLLCPIRWKPARDAVARNLPRVRQEINSGASGLQCQAEILASPNPQSSRLANWFAVDEYPPSRSRVFSCRQRSVRRYDVAEIHADALGSGSGDGMAARANPSPSSREGDVLGDVLEDRHPVGIRQEFVKLQSDRDHSDPKLRRLWPLKRLGKRPEHSGAAFSQRLVGYPSATSRSPGTLVLCAECSSHRETPSNNRVVTLVDAR